MIHHTIHKRGFTLMETVVALGIFTIFVMGVYGSIQLSFSLVYHSRVRIVETALLNEQLEIMHNVPFDSVGIVNGSPSGIFDHVTTTLRNGMLFEITRTIRNIDDPYDGVIGGTPLDTVPTDYKFVQVEVRCASCGQIETVSMYTYISPKYLEGNPDHGALFVHIIDAYGNPVENASVHIIATSTNPSYNFIDTTDANGYLRIYDLATGTEKYSVEVYKSGYTTDMTQKTSSTNPNPTTPLVSIIQQSVSNLTLTIDHTSLLEIQTKNIQCTAVGNAQMTLKGTRVIGTNPEVFLINSTYTTNAAGTTGAVTLPWDNYGMLVSEYDLIGTIPDVPMSLLPGSSEVAQLIVGPNTPRSLIVMAEYQGAPIANATVTVTGPNGFSTTKTTGVGSISQTDWSLGSGHETFGEGRGFSNGSGIDVNVNTGNIVLGQSGGNYVSSGYLESSTIDAGENARYIVWSWNPMGQSPSTTLRLQIATSASSTDQSWNFIGPDGTENSYFNESNVSIPAIHNDRRYVRYKVYMDTIDSVVTPVLSDLTLVYTNACFPPGQTYLGGLSEGEYTIHIDADGFQDYEEPLMVTDDHFVIAELTSL